MQRNVNSPHFVSTCTSILDNSTFRFPQSSYCCIYTCTHDISHLGHQRFHLMVNWCIFTDDCHPAILFLEIDYTHESCFRERRLGKPYFPLTAWHWAIHCCTCLLKHMYIGKRTEGGKSIRNEKRKLDRLKEDGIFPSSFSSFIFSKQESLSLHLLRFNQVRV